MGGRLSIRGVVRSSSGDVAPGVYVFVQVYGQKGGWDIGHIGDWDVFTDETGAYSFDHLPSLQKGHYEIHLNSRQEYGKTYENSVYWIGVDEIKGDLYVLDAQVYPVTGSAFCGAIQYQDADGAIKSFYAPPFTAPEPGHVLELHRGISEENHEYGIGVEHCTIDGNGTTWNGLAGGTYYVTFTYRMSDGVMVHCSSPSFDIPPGETRQFEYTILECPPMADPLLP